MAIEFCTLSRTKTRQWVQLICCCIRLPIMLLAALFQVTVSRSVVRTATGKAKSVLL